MNKITAFVVFLVMGFFAYFNEIRLQNVEASLEMQRLEAKKTNENLIILGEMMMREHDAKSARVIKGMENSPWYDEDDSSEWYQIEK